MMILIPECPNTIIALSNIEVGRQRLKQRNATIVNIISSVVFVPNFITNNFEVDALTIALLHKHRWQIELFFILDNKIRLQNMMISRTHLFIFDFPSAENL